ncbi:hypothetical protein JXB28_06385 [Candidatus Woesearchaeota archaeon]|nr:hypothetical protein [Candidatus Woesearchaeota archaeon]
MKQKYILITALCIILVLNAWMAEAAVIGANKGVLSYRNVLKDGYAQDLVTLTTDTDFNLSITYKVEGEAAEWIRLEPESQPFFISKDNPYVVAVVVEPPPDARNQQYSATIRFITGALAGPEGQFGTAVRAAIQLRLGVEITGQEMVSCSATGFAMEDVEEGYPFEFYSVVTNNGNVRIKPEFVLEFWNQDQTELVKSFSLITNESILPTVQKRVFHSFSHALPIGQYWVKISTPTCGGSGSGFITASVFERGGVSDKGELLKIEHDAWVKTGDIIPIDAIFQNLGSRIVSAKFKGTISSGDNIFKIIDTDPLDVQPGEIVSLRTYFNPIQEGQYMITGRVLYNKKLTFDKSSVLNVNPSGEPPEQGKTLGATTIALIFILCIIIFILIMIFKRKKKLGRGQRK